MNIDRRGFGLGGLSAAASLACAASARAAILRPDRSKRLFCYVGSWTEGKGGAGGRGGVHVMSVEPKNGVMTHLQSVDPQINAGYLAVSPDGSSLFVNDERRDFGGIPGSGGGVLGYSIDRKSGLLTRRSKVSSMGANPAYISVDKTGRRFAVANHAGYEPVVHVRDRQIVRAFDDATVALFDALPQGQIGGVKAVATLVPAAGPAPAVWTGLPPTFAASPHAHSVNWDPTNRWIVVCDKGGDRIFTFSVEHDNLIASQCFRARPGSSPRHSAFHPTLPLIFVVNEQGPTLSMFRFNPENGSLSHLQTIDTVDIPSPPEAPVFIPADVHVHPFMPMVYATTRRANSIAALRLSGHPGRMERIQVVGSGGQTPRSCAIDPQGRFLFAGNQDSGNIQVFRIDPQTGKLQEPRMAAALPKPVCLKFLAL